jgi:hypothetical protein
MENLPFNIGLTFTFSTFLTLYFFYKASNQSKAIILLVLWMVLQMGIALSGFYVNTNTVPPRFLLMVLPPMALILVLFNTKKGKEFIDHLNLKYLYLLHIVRIPVELVLFWLSIEKVVPELMTFEGRNFDIISGITAPLVYYFGFLKNKLSKKHVIGLEFPLFDFTHKHRCSCYFICTICLSTICL